MYSDNKFRKLLKHNRRNGWAPDMNNAIAIYVGENEDIDEYRFITVPFNEGSRRRRLFSSDIEGSNNETKEERYITWFDRRVNELPRVIGHNFNRSDDSGSEISAQGNGYENDGWEMTVTTIQGGNVTESDKNRVAKSDAVKAQAHEDKNYEWCYLKLVECDSYDWTCIISLASAYAGTVVACGDCLAGTKLGCGLCLLGVGGSGAGTYDCAQTGPVYKDNCSVEKKWVKWEAVSEYYGSGKDGVKCLELREESEPDPV